MLCATRRDPKEWAVGEDRGIVAFEGFVLARVRRKECNGARPPIFCGSNKGFPNLREKSSGFLCSSRSVLAPGISKTSGCVESLPKTSDKKNFKQTRALRLPYAKYAWTLHSASEHCRTRRHSEADFLGGASRCYLWRPVPAENLRRRSGGREEGRELVPPRTPRHLP